MQDKKYKLYYKRIGYCIKEALVNNYFIRGYSFKYYLIFIKSFPKVNNNNIFLFILLFN